MRKFSGLRKRGITAVETLVSLIVGSFVALIVFQQFISLLAGVKANSDMGGTSADVRKALDTMSDHVRNAQICTATGTYQNAALKSGATAAFEYFTDATGNKTVKYTYDSANKWLIRTEDGAAASTGIVVVRGISSFSLTYYKTDYYNQAWTAMSSAPTNADLPKVCGIRMDLTITSNATATRISTLVRMRNVPKKVGLDGVS